MHKDNYKLNMYYPKVLILGQPINQVSGGTITISNLFHDWPADRLAVAHNSHYGHDQKRAREFRLRMELVVPWVHWGIEWPTRQQRHAFFNNPVSDKVMPYRKKNFHRDMFGKLIEFFCIQGLIRQFPLTRELIDFVTDFKPDLIYSHLGDIPVAHLFMQLTNRFSIPSIVHIMDDYPSTLYRNGLFSAAVRRTMYEQLNEIFGRAEMRMGICQKMCDEYTLLYGKEFIPFHNPVDLSVWGRDTLRNKSDMKHNIKIMYSGRVGLSCLTSLYDICEVVKNWQDKSVSVSFDIFVNDIHQALETAPFLRHLSHHNRVFEAPKSAEKIASLLMSADILLLPVDFDNESIEYIRLSMPTKIPAYMATGIPILVYGPPEVASVKYAKTERWAHVIDVRSSEALMQGILCLAMDKDLRARLSQRSRQIAGINHDALQVRERFKEYILRVARAQKF